MKRKYSKLFILVIALFILIPAASFAQEYLQKQRVVVLVYDDSGSMKEDRNEKPVDNWKYASYALQSLIALLDERDEMYVTKMSEPEKAQPIPMDAAVSEMENIRSWEASGSTPFQAIATSFEKLEDVTAENKEAEFWFVLLTDGVVNEMSKGSYSDEKDYKKAVKQIEDTLQNYKSAIIDQDGLDITPTLITIESDLGKKELEEIHQFKKLWKETIGGNILTANSKEEIVERINEVAALISNRDPESSEGSELVLNPRFEGNTIILARRLGSGRPVCSGKSGNEC